MLATDKHSSLTQTFVNYGQKKFLTLDPGPWRLPKTGAPENVPSLSFLIVYEQTQLIWPEPQFRWPSFRPAWGRSGLFRGWESSSGSWRRPSGRTERWGCRSSPGRLCSSCCQGYKTFLVFVVKLSQSVFFSSEIWQPSVITAGKFGAYLSAAAPRHSK